MICAFCGLETGSPTSHETQEACIQALRSQVSELRHLLEHTRNPGDEPVSAGARLPEGVATVGCPGRDQSG